LRPSIHADASGCGVGNLFPIASTTHVYFATIPARWRLDGCRIWRYRMAVAIDRGVEVIRL
jgi:hypothetical protein